MAWQDAYNDPDPLNFSKPHFHVAMVLSHVCSRWRSISHSIPLLWSRVNVQFPSISKNSISLVQMFVNTCLEKSHEEPLHFTFIAPSSGQAHTPVLIEAVKHAHRWKKAMLRLGADDISNLPDILPMLEVLVIKDHLFTRLGMSASMIGRILVPSIRSLAVTQSDSGLDTCFDLSSLTSLSIRSSFRVVFGLLQRCSRIVSADIRIISFEPTGPVELNVVLTHLRSLKVYYYCLKGVLGFLTTPSLEELRVHAEDLSPRTHSFPYSDFCSFIRRSQMPLITLDISHHVLTDSQLLSMLSMLNSTLSHLIFHAATSYQSDRALNDTFFRRMTLQSVSHSSILPHLSHLELGLAAPVNTALIVQMVQSRSSCLKSFTLIHEIPLCYEDFDVLSNLEDLVFTICEEQQRRRGRGL
ncbi:hypothetical protein VNI00_007789 [Paramarasmius palmivorus]|uniref:F-box domain-containing protein n=1 Tax=Paramarasmius palmivorus TaxID=297713 RepID=A0AAW0CY22_9AGAR